MTKKTKREIREFGAQVREIVLTVDAKSAERKAALAKKKYERAATIKNVASLKAKGYSNVAIGKQVGLSESSVRRLLKENERIQGFVDDMTAHLEEARDEILRHMSSHPDFETLFGSGFGGKYILNVHSVETQTVFSMNSSKIEFDLRFEATKKTD